MSERAAYEAIPFDDDADEVKTWKGLALSAISDLRRYAGDELPHRRMVSVEAYEADAVRLHGDAPEAAAPVTPTVKACAEFIKWALQEGSWEGGDLDGGSIQDKAEALGLVAKVEFDPAKHDDIMGGSEPGDPWFVFSDELKALASGQQSAATSDGPVAWAAFNKDGGRVGTTDDPDTVKYWEKLGWTMKALVYAAPAPSPEPDAVRALEPFLTFAKDNVSNVEGGYVWGSNIHREPISTWFGPSDFGVLNFFAAALSAPVAGAWQDITLKIEQGGAGLWYVTSGQIPGLLVAEQTHGLALNKVGHVLWNMQKTRLLARNQRGSEAK